MTYSIKEMYYTLQGEGAQSGRPAVFLRFAGCNLWSGREQDRDKGPGGCSKWCDTNFVGTNGPGGGKFDTPEDLAEAVAKYWPDTTDVAPYVVCTGGEPLLQLDEAAISALHSRGFEVAVETNGTLVAPAGIDWLCVSPKAGSKLAQITGDELKLVYPQTGAMPEDFVHFGFERFFLQPMDGPQLVENTRAAIAYCLAYPKWRLSVQSHKMLGIP